MTPLQDHPNVALLLEADADMVEGDAVFRIKAALDRAAADAAPLEYRHLIGFALLVDKHVGLALHTLPVSAKQVASVVRYVAGLQHHDRQPD